MILELTSSSQQVDTNLVNHHFDKIISTTLPRNHKNVMVLNHVADYIHSVFNTYTDSVQFQNFNVEGKTYKNVIASFNSSCEKRIIVGAHYDVCGSQDGADDNASGVVGLLEIARLLKDVKLDYRIDLVAYSLEEPPFFGTENMGSYVHAKWLHDHEIKVMGMICLEMIGYFDDTAGSQHFPVAFLKLFYGDKGDFITTVRKLIGGRFAKKFTKNMKKTTLIPSRSFQGPKGLAGLDFSDHRNYWHFGYSAVMITNTAFYRNQNYHEDSDDLSTIDVNRMSAVIQTVYEALIQIGIK